jgi:hypothetical protein
MYWLLIVQLFVGSEWLPAVYEDTHAPVTHIYRTQLECLAESQAYNIARDATQERAICVEIK